MVALKLPVFAGMIPSLDKHALSEKNAAFSENTWLYSGALTGVPKPVFLHELVNPNATKAFRIPLPTTDGSYIHSGYWVEFENSNTCFLSAPVASDTFKRYYWASPSTVPMYNTAQRIIDELPPFLLGLPPGPSMTVTPAGGSSPTLVSRAYVTTLVSAYGEEGPAGVPFLINGKLDDTFTVDINGIDPDDMGVNRNVTNIRLYRTITSNQGTTTYYLLHTFTADEDPQTYADTTTDAALASGSILESTAWTAPPNLKGMVMLANGIVAGWVNNEIWFSEPYRPHAWPAAYSLTLDFDIVGMGVVNQTLVICTEGSLYTASGVNPASITTSKLAAFEPCLSFGSIVSSEEGVYYASPNGLILVNAGVAQNVTKDAISKDEWAKIAKDSARVRSAKLGQAYFAFGVGTSRTFSSAFDEDFVQNETVTGTAKGFLLDVFNSNAGVNYLRISTPVENVMNDVLSSELFAIIGNNVYWFSQEPEYEMQPYTWKSKTFQLPSAKNFAAFKCYFTPPKNYVPNPTPNYTVGQVFNPEAQIAVVNVYADGTLVASRELIKSGELHKLPTGFIAEFWEVKIEARVRIHNFQMATSVKELSIA
jgi:hypothetical protein